MKRKALIIPLVLASLLIASSFISLTQADSKTIVTRRSVGTLGYTQINVVLGDANNTIKIPDNWNGALVMLCRGYSASVESIAPLGLKFSPNTIPCDTWTGFLTNGYATAASNYGTGGMSIKEGIISTHQLTQYVINNYGVTGKVYVVGLSMGGNIALQLGAKYPELYAGVLDLCGPKDMASQYNDKIYYAGLTNDNELASVITSRGGVVPPYPTPSVANFRLFSNYSSSDIAITCGGTPNEKPKAYERISPIFSASDIAIPTITIHGTADILSPYSGSLQFMNAVEQQGHSDLYRLYKVIGAQHGNPALMSQLSIRFAQLVMWAEDGIPAPQSIT